MELIALIPAFLLLTDAQRSSGLEFENPGRILVVEPERGSIVDISGGGDFTKAPRFATGLSRPVDICLGPGEELLALEATSGEVTVASTGGDLSASPPLVSGLEDPLLLACSDSMVLVAEAFSGRILDVTDGGDASTARVFADGAFGVSDLLVLPGGAVWMTERITWGVFDISEGGSISELSPFASGATSFQAPFGLATRNGALLAAVPARDAIIDVTSGGDFSAAPVFASLLVPQAILSVEFGPLLAVAETPTSEEGVFDASSGGDVTLAPFFAEGIAPLGGAGGGLLHLPGCGDGAPDPSVEECDDGNNLEGDGCSSDCEIQLCPANPAPSCLRSERAKLAISERKAGRETFKLSLRRFAEPLVALDFGNPLSDESRFDICTYDEAGDLVGDLVLESLGGAVCGSKPCWKSLRGRGWRYTDREGATDGVRKLVAKAGSGSILLQAKNNSRKSQSSLPVGFSDSLYLNAGATVQVHVAGGGCLEGVMSTVKKADGGRFSAKQ